MATSFVHGTAAPAPRRGAVAFLFARPDAAPDFAAALEAAAAAERAARTSGRNTRCRVSYLLCELGHQLRGQTGSFDCSAALPLSRVALAEVLGVPLSKVKRVLALLSLSHILMTDGRSIEVLNWQRLCDVAHIDPDRLGLSVDEDDEPLIANLASEEDSARLLTASGEPACFV